jgi:hypothetical protein
MGKWIPVVSLICIHTEGNGKVQFITDSFEQFLTSPEAEASAEALVNARFASWFPVAWQVFKWNAN